MTILVGSRTVRRWPAVRICAQTCCVMLPPGEPGVPEATILILCYLSRTATAGVHEPQDMIAQCEQLFRKSGDSAPGPLK